MNLVVGANLALSGTRWDFSLSFPIDIRYDLGLAVLPVDESKHLVADTVLAHHPNTHWLTSELVNNGTQFNLTFDTNRLPDTRITRLQLVLYRYGAKGPLDFAQQVTLQQENVFTHTLDLKPISASALIIAELYQRNGAWKIRALAETSAYGLSALGRRMGAEIDERSPHSPSSGSYGASNERPEAWSGTGFLVSPNLFMTNAHVVEGARQLRLTSIQGKLDAEVVISDETNDLALVRAACPSHIHPLAFRKTSIGLAEPITTLGYPLASIMGSGIQATQGVISGLFGAQNDIRLLQFTAPIQPGSSGSPLLDNTGAVLGVVSSSFVNTQNMNFAVRNVLALALLEAVQAPYQLQVNERTLSTAQIAQQTQAAIWRVECMS
ncbi:trypsin-like peptidase domain-containing protein [Thiofilum flexile]|uniref:trypsin-like peptidase domain-containing protein n=1 Tax=Thiofilum flexile TaxID=125627 RepID=UPI00036ABBF2|nr:trypsin-like peptidase domain-containing protein [Thiofilum flexile]